MRSKLLIKNGANAIQMSAESNRHKLVEEDISLRAVRPLGGILLTTHGDRAASLLQCGKGPAAT